MRIQVARADVVPERGALKFSFTRGGYPETGILARHDGRLVAYVNRCRHQPYPLDWDDGKFYSIDREHLVCRTHGALYDPASGLCVLGPCAGLGLEPLRVVVEGDHVYVETGE